MGNLTVIEKGISITIDNYHESDDPQLQEVVDLLLKQICLSLTLCGMEPDKWQLYADLHNVVANRLLQDTEEMGRYRIKWVLYSRPDGPFYGLDIEEFIGEPTEFDVLGIMADVADPHPTEENLERMPCFSDSVSGSCNPSHWRITSIKRI